MTEFVDTIREELQSVSREVRQIGRARLPAVHAVSADTRDAQLSILQKVWFLKNLILELQHQFDESFAENYEQIYQSTVKLGVKIAEIRSLVNKLAAEELKSSNNDKMSDKISTTPGQGPISRTNTMSSSSSALPGAFTDFSPEALKNTISDKELLDAVTKVSDVSNNLTIIRVFNNKHESFLQQFLKNLIGLLRSYATINADNICISKSLEVDVTAFFTFITKNETKLLKNAQFESEFNALLTKLADKIDAIVVKGAVLKENSDSLTLSSGTVKPINCIRDFTAFYVKLPAYLQRLLNTKLHHKSSAKIASYLVFYLVWLTDSNFKTFQDPDKTHQLTAALKLVYILTEFRVINKKDVQFLKLKSSDFKLKVTDKNALELYLQDLFKTDEQLCIKYLPQLLHFCLDKRVNESVNDIKKFLQKFDTYDLIFHELVERKEIKTNTPATTKEEPAETQEKPTLTLKSYDQDALDALNGKLDAPVDLTSPLSPVTPLSPFAANNSKRFSTKKPDEDRKRLSKRFSRPNIDANVVSKRLSRRFDTDNTDWSWNDEADDVDDAWGNDEELDFSEDEDLKKKKSAECLKNMKSMSSVKSGKSTRSRAESLGMDEWGWGIEEDELEDTLEPAFGKENESENKNVNAKEKKSLGKKFEDEKDVVKEPEQANLSYHTTKIPDELVRIVEEFLNYCDDILTTGYFENYEIVAKVAELVNIFFIIGGYAKYDSKFLFYNDVHYFNSKVKQILVEKKLLEDDQALADEKIEQYLTNMINLEKMSFLKIYRKFQNFSNLANAQNTSMILNQLEFKFKEMFFASFQSLSKDLQQMIIINFLNEFYQLMLNDILQIDMISEHDCDELSKIIDFMLNFVNFFHNKKVAPEVEPGSPEFQLLCSNDENVNFFKKNVVNHSKLNNFKLIISSHLASIMEYFYNGDFYNVETAELIRLIESLFVDSDRRRAAISEIEAIRDIKL